MKHQGNVDKNGNFRDISREKEGYFGVESKDLPFPALVTAWYPKSQTMDVIRPTEIGAIEYKRVVVYGNFFEETGTIQSPKLATLLKEDGYTTVRDEDQKDPDSDSYVLNTHIEALVFKTSVGFAAQSFRFLNPESPMLNNAKEGRKITRHDDGSYYVHDEDGNMQFVHPSGLKLRIGDSTSDIDLEVPFPEHEKNAQNYNSEINVKLEHPSGSYYGFESNGDFKISAPNVGIDASTKFTVTSPESEMTGNLTVGGIIKAVGDIIADWMVTAISLINHFSLGNLGFNTAKPLPGGSAGTPPNNSPSYDSGTDTADVKGMDVKNVGPMTKSVGTHDHNYTWTDPAGSGTTNAPN